MNNPFHVDPDGEIPDDVAEQLKGTYPSEQPKAKGRPVASANTGVFIAVLTGIVVLALCSLFPALTSPANTPTRTPYSTVVIPTDTAVPPMRPSMLDVLKSCAGVPAPRDGYLVVEVELEYAPSELVRTDMDGKMLCRITRDGIDNSNPSISPDGKKILYSTGWRYETTLHMVNGDGTNNHQIEVLTGDADWSPNGQDVVFPQIKALAADIYTARLDGEPVALKNLTRDSYQRDYGDAAPAWSLDGKLIAFVSERDTVSAGKKGLELYVIQPDGNGLRRLTENETVTMSPAWLPDGRIVFLQLVKDTFGSEIFSIKPDGSELTQLTSTGDLKLNLATSPDGRYIYYGQDKALYRVNLREDAAVEKVADIDAKTLDVWVAQ